MSVIGSELRALTKSANEAYVAFYAAMLNAPATPEFERLRALNYALGASVIHAENALKLDTNLPDAAPEMLAALESVVENMEGDISLMLDHEVDCPGPEECCLCKARAAIKKAKGE